MPSWEPIPLLRRRKPQLQVPLVARPATSFIRGASPLGLPYTLSRSPLRRLAPFASLASLRSLAVRSSNVARIAPAPSPRPGDTEFADSDSPEDDQL